MYDWYIFRLPDDHCFDSRRIDVCDICPFSGITPTNGEMHWEENKPIVSSLSRDQGACEMQQNVRKQASVWPGECTNVNTK